MSGCTSPGTCPNCETDVEVYDDWKPVNYSMQNCLNCGLVLFPAQAYETLETLNRKRAEHNETMEGEEDWVPLEPYTQEEFDKIERTWRYFLVHEDERYFLPE